MRKILAAVCFCCIVLLSCTTAFAQTITGSVRGTVTEPSGAVVAGANVTATNVATGVATKTVTNRSGLYNFQFLTIGNYTITVTSPGFSTASVGPFKLQIDQIAKADAKLTVGEVTTTVKVASDAGVILNTENATLGTTISSNTLENMPLNGQNVQIATLFVPGSTNPNSASMGGLMGTERDSYQNYAEPADDQPSFNGNRQQANNYILDGIDINETISNALGYNPSPFSIQETRIITGNADAEYGNVNGGEIVMVTKGGTNRFHGSAFEYHEASGLTANSWSNNFANVKRTNFSQNQFGGAVGGPIFRNKLFFFANYIGFRQNTPPSEKGTSVPTLAERGLAPGNTPGVADLSAVSAIEGIQVYDTTNGYAAATPYVNNQVPIVNPVAKFLFAHPEIYPLPNNTPTAGTVAGNNYIGKVASNTYNNQGDIRVDYTATPKDTFMVKYTMGDAYDLQTRTVIPVIFPSGNDYPTTSAVVEWIRTFSSSLVNEARAGYTRILLNQGTTSDPSGVFGKHGDAVIGIPLPNQAIDGFTFMNVGGGINNFGVANYIGTYNLDNNFDYSDDLTWEHGNHITKFGVQFLRYQENYFAPGNLGGQLGNFSFNKNYTAKKGVSPGYGYASFLLDKASNVSIAGVTGPFGQRQWRNAFYVQDDWKILPNLTLNLGVRYAYNQPIYEVHNKQVNVNLPKARFAPLGTDVQSLLNYAGKNGNSRALYNPYYLGIMPRFGFALQVSPRAVLRGGYGITDAQESTGTGLRMTQNPPFQPQFSQGAQVPTATSGGTWFKVENGFTALPDTNVAGSQFDAWDPNFRPSTIQQFNLTAQYLIDTHTSVQVGYVGQLGQHLAVPLWLNQYTETPPTPCDAACYQSIVPYDALVGVGGVVIETTSRGVSNYNALQATLQHQQTNGLEFSLNYTWGKSMTNNPGYFGVDGADNSDSFWQDVNDPQAEYGPTTFDAHNILSGIMVYQLPFGHEKQFGAHWGRLTDEAFGGWQISGTAQLHTGYPVTITTGATCSNNCGAQADYVEHANQYFPMRIVHRSVAHWFGTDPTSMPCEGPGQTINDSGAPCAYGTAAPTEYGSARVGTERAPGYRQIDLSLFKGFRTVGDQFFKVRVDAFNAFNIASYGFPSRAADSPSNFGQITGTLSPARQIQLSAIYQF